MYSMKKNISLVVIFCTYLLVFSANASHTVWVVRSVPECPSQPLLDKSKVRVSYTITVDGTVKNITVVSAENLLLDKKAIKAAKSHKYDMIKNRFPPEGISNYFVTIDFNHCL